MVTEYAGKATTGKPFEGKDCPSIEDAKEIGLKYRLSGVVIIFHDDRNAGVVSWGHDRNECAWIRRYAGRCWLELMKMWNSARAGAGVESEAR